MQNSASFDEDLIDVRGYLINLWDHRRWYFFALVICLAIAFAVNKYTAPKYSVRATLFVPQDKKASDATLMKELEIFQPSINIANEIEILKSFTLSQKVVDSLQLNVQFFENGWVHQRELYGENLPLTLIVDSIVPNTAKQTLSLKIVDQSHYRLEVSGTDELVQPNVQFGQVVRTENLRFRIETNTSAVINEGQMIEVDIYHPSVFARQLQENIDVKAVDAKGSILEVHLETSVPERGVLIVNSLLDFYFKREMGLKNQVATKAINFIDLQLEGVESRLFLAEERLQSFRTQNNIVDISQEGQSVYNQLSELEKESSDIGTQLDYYSYLIQYLDKPATESIISPSAAGISDPALNNLIVKLNEISNQLIVVGSNASELNPQVKSLRMQFSAVRESIRENVLNLRNRNMLYQKDIDSRIRLAEKKLNQLPGNERQLININRELGLNDEIYVYLLKQRAEAAIAMASNEASSKVVDSGYVKGQSQPKRALNLAVGLLLGLVLPTIAIAAIDFFSSTIRKIDEIYAATDIPVLSSIDYYNYSTQLVVTEIPESCVAQDLRQLRAALRSLSTMSSTSSTVMFTSQGRKEGKTFLALNTAILMAQTGAKTLLLDLDLRKPELYKALNLKNELGIADIVTGSQQMDKIIQSTDIDNLDFFSSGVLKHRPDQILLSKPFEEAMNFLKQTYQYMIIDTSPLGLTADALELSGFIDSTVYVVRYGVSGDQAIGMLNEYSQRKLISNPGIVFNGVQPKNRLG